MTTLKCRRLIVGMAWLLLPFFPSAALHAQHLVAAGSDTAAAYRQAPLYIIGDTNFRIPTGYIRFADQKTGGTLPGISLYALLPDLLPYSRDTKKEFDDPMSAQVIRVSIRVQDAILFGQNFPVLTRAAIYERIVRDATTGNAPKVIDKQGPYGLIRRELVPPRSDRELFVGRNADGSLFWVTCSADRYINPQCDTQIEYSPHVTVAYFFSKKLLSDWQTLDEKVIAFVRQFQQ